MALCTADEQPKRGERTQRRSHPAGGVARLSADASTANVARDPVMKRALSSLRWSTTPIIAWRARGPGRAAVVASSNELASLFRSGVKAS